MRLALLEALALEGPLTATAAGELIAESPTTCSFHLRQLAKYGFVEEDSPGPGRQRPWKLAFDGLRIRGVHDDAETNVAAKSLERLFFDRALARLRNFLDTKSDFPAPWRRASETTQSLLYLTPDELVEVTGELRELLEQRRLERLDPTSRPDGALPVEVLLFGFPLRTQRSAT
ncbi:MAG: helix-turn-helix domain-containing protein [Acidimicrobiales bacterium]